MANKTGTEIKAWAQTLIDSGTITDANALIWINEFLTQKLGIYAYLIEADEQVGASDDTWIGLPDDYEDIFKVESFADDTLEGESIDYTSFEIYNSQIRYKTAGNYINYYLILSEELTELDDSMTVDQCFNLACATWLAYRQLTLKDDENAAPETLGAKREKEFYTELERAAAYRKRKLRRGAAKVENINYGYRCER
jgi:hypothetical protein